MRTSSLIAIVAAALLSACAQTPMPAGQSPADAAVPSGTCDAARITAAIGRNPDPQVQDDLRRQAGADTVRVLRHDQPITKEFRVGRLNLVLDAQGRIASANCS